MYWNISICFLALHGICTSLAGGVDLLVFSKNRPMQLYALLESVKTHITGVNQITVIYCSTSKQFDAAYKKVFQTFAHVQSIKQSSNPREDFKKLTCGAVSKMPSEYVLFAVDDIVVTGKVNLEHCIDMLKKTGAYAFYLRLGQDITECYSISHTGNRVTGQPPLRQVSEDVITWQFKDGQGDWDYPHTVDMTLYRKKDVKPYLFAMAYTTPNTLEGHWAGRAQPIRHLHGLCFAESKIVNLPLNMVQNDCNNRHEGSFDAEGLLAQFERGLKIDIQDLYRLPHKAPHVGYIPQFVAR